MTAAFDEAFGTEADPEETGIDTVTVAVEDDAPEPEPESAQDHPIEGDDAGQEPPAETEPEPTEDQATAPETEGEVEPRFTRVDREALSPELQRLHDQMQAEYQAQIGGLGKSREDLQLAGQHAEFIRAVMDNPQLQEHIRGFWEGQQAPRQHPHAQGEDPPMLRQVDPNERPEDLDYFDPDSQEDVLKILEIAERRLSPKFERALQERDAKLARYEQHFAELERRQEEEELSRSYPNWDKHVSKEDLAQARQVAPNLPLSSLLKILDYDNAVARSSRTARSEEIEKLTARRAPPRTPGRRVDHQKAPETFEDIWDDVIGGS